MALNGDVAETVVTLGLGARLVGVDTSATYPEKLVARVPKIGYQRTLAAEGILSLRPTLVVGTPGAGPPTTIAQLRSAGVTVVIIPEYKGLDAGPRKLRALGRALGVPKRGERLARAGREPDRDREARGRKHELEAEGRLPLRPRDAGADDRREGIGRGRDDRGGRRP